LQNGGGPYIPVGPQSDRNLEMPAESIFIVSRDALADRYLQRMSGGILAKNFLGSLNCAIHGITAQILLTQSY
jgi:hypothetical protein